MQTNKKLSLTEMQELLPDYTFGKLSEVETQIFENNLPDYPELMSEITEVKTVFERFEAIDFDKLIADETRNLSIKVNNRLERKSRFSLAIFNKFAVPAVLALALIYLAINSNKLGTNIPNKADKKTEIASSHPSSRPPILPEKYKAYIKENANKPAPEVKTQVVLLNQSNNDFSEANDLKNISDDNAIDDLDDLEFYSILEELDDVDFGS